MTELLIQRPDDSREYDSTIVRFSEDEEYNTANINPLGNNLKMILKKENNSHIIFTLEKKDIWSTSIK
jgi:hypothetical protein